MKKSTKILTIVAAGALIAGAITACSHHYAPPEEKAEWMVQRVEKKLELDAGQSQQLAQLKQKLLAFYGEHKTQQEQNRLALQQLLTAPALDRQQMITMVQQRTTLINQQAPEVVDAVADLYESLNDTQREQVREHLAEFSQHRCHHW